MARGLQLALRRAPFPGTLSTTYLVQFVIHGVQ